MAIYKNPAYLAVFHQKGVDLFIEYNQPETVQDWPIKCEDESLPTAFSEYWPNLSSLRSPVAMC